MYYIMCTVDNTTKHAFLGYCCRHLGVIYSNLQSRTALALVALYCKMKNDYGCWYVQNFKIKISQKKAVQSIKVFLFLLSDRLKLVVVTALFYR